jgi:hypothetical protein
MMVFVLAPAPFLLLVLLCSSPIVAKSDTYTVRYMGRELKWCHQVQWSRSKFLNKDKIDRRIIRAHQRRREVRVDSTVYTVLIDFSHSLF